ncbi:hypothetical protein EV44_g4530 [Erysiphe necator]|uniref:Uncharacterized protein n=1 Tax=Uncinula necator TaxID=52586 RepID=A0A0B1P3F9_UNCNE|nr:hypothetical protein EV44_g4530 [Erysiphe necator]
MNPDVDITSLLTESINNKTTTTTNTTTTTSPLSLESPEQHHQKQNNLIPSPSLSRAVIADPESVSPQVASTSSGTSNAIRTTTATTRSRHVSGGTTEDRLTLLPEKRPLPWREGVDPGAENETGGESRRKQIRFGCLLATRGDVQAIPCNTCANGRGKFSVCISLPNFFRGACASCQLSGRPNRCSIKKTEDTPENPNIIRVLNLSQAHSVENSSLPHYESNGNHPKRRKLTATMITNNAPTWDETQRRWGQELSDGSMSQLNSGSRKWATVNRQTATKSIESIMKSITDDRHTDPKSVANVNSHSELSRNWSSITQIQGEKTTNGFAPQSNRSTEENNVPCEIEQKIVIIDTLPKAKQRQVYGLISGIQGGIDHLQCELNSLKNALGIDDKD